ncbi:cysteine desulfurase [Spirosoma sp. BT702]|uniref:cysteine desulfurase n=1 Tax=Spirosoma profusum TaxID=2771354 RepID=A0A927AV29_9BACT|nr:cysteine desulfurase family protein [Spirosoma profusum]MBD2704936.1 cysteine desulfurase [Spirosoma profusum]
MSQTIYLDNHATTACDPLVVADMLPFFTQIYGNASSAHQFGFEANEAVNLARSRVANLIGAQAEEIIFTSGATESNNLAILGSAIKHQQIGGKRKRIITTSIEHKSVLAPFQYLADLDWEVILLPVDKLGTVRLDIAERLINEDTLLVSIQAANSEIGTIQPITTIARMAHQVGALLHCDAAQAVGKIPLSVVEWDVDLLSVSGHKLHGPKGVGALYIRGGTDQLPLSPLIRGGSQEQGLRAGTLPVPLLVGFGKACELSQDDLPDHSQWMSTLRDQLETNLLKNIGPLRVNGNVSNRLPNNTNITFFEIEADMLMACLPDIVLSTGSACESGSMEPSNVLINIGMDYEECFCTIRFGLSRYTSFEEINRVTQTIASAWRSLAPSNVNSVNGL